MVKSLESRKIWIEKGYEHFALYGPENLSINKISKEIGSSRASFYHFFGDLDVFIEELLDKHWEIGQDFNSAGIESCKRLFPDLYKLVEKYPIPLQFTRQLFLNRHIPAFNYMFNKMYCSHSHSFILTLFAEQYSLHQSKEIIENLWKTVGDSWYSRLNPDNLSAVKMQQLSEEIMNSVLKFMASDLYSKMRGHRQ